MKDLLKRNEKDDYKLLSNATCEYLRHRMRQYVDREAINYLNEKYHLGLEFDKNASRLKMMGDLYDYLDGTAEMRIRDIARDRLGIQHDHAYKDPEKRAKKDRSIDWWLKKYIREKGISK